MKFLSVASLPKPYENKVAVVLEESFRDQKDGHEIFFAKPYIIPSSGIGSVTVGDNVELLFNRFKKPDSLRKIANEVK